jgi:hypothetical protein
VCLSMCLDRIIIVNFFRLLLCFVTIYNCRLLSKTQVVQKRFMVNLKKLFYLAITSLSCSVITSLLCSS